MIGYKDIATLSTEQKIVIAAADAGPVEYYDAGGNGYSGDGGTPVAYLIIRQPKM